MAWPKLESLIRLGTSKPMPERSARNVRVTNGLALITGLLSLASIPFDLVAGPRWFELYDVLALLVGGACLTLNALGRTTASRIAFFVGLNIIFVCTSMALGHVSDQRLLFLALAVAPFLDFDLSERKPLASMTLFAVICYSVVEWVAGPDSVRPGVYDYNVPFYRVYSAMLTFAGLVGGVWHFKRETRRAEQAVRARERLLDEVRLRSIAASRMAALGEMAGGVAHEVRNPLAALQLAVKQLESVSDSHSAPQTARIKRSAQRIARIVDSLLFFARDASSDPFAPADLDQILRDTLELCRQRFVDHAIDLQIVRDASRPVSIECRAGELSQAVVNLLSNAYDAVLEEQERWVRLEIVASRDDLEISVTDSGPGIPRTLRDKVFEPFFTTKDPGSGTGLGLSVACGIVEAHHGRLFVDDESPHTRFVMRLPLRYVARGSRPTREPRTHVPSIPTHQYQ